MLHDYYHGLLGSLTNPDSSAFCASNGHAASRAVTNTASRPARRRDLTQRMNKAMTAEASINLHSPEIQVAIKKQVVVKAFESPDSLTDAMVSK
jgi:hypothetical protein